jgi:hypothetical protein
MRMTKDMPKYSKRTRITAHLKSRNLTPRVSDQAQCRKEPTIRIPDKISGDDSWPNLMRIWFRVGGGRKANSGKSDQSRT